ncbi:MAG: porin family protein [Chitinophagaceae bacterium]|nr:porin family protein [Chitinophagaceae bacterium]
MNKKFLSIAMISASCFFLSDVKAQDNLSFGVLGNVGHTWMSGDGENKFKPALGAGLRLVYSANANLGIGGDLKFSAEGARKEFNNGLTDVKVNLNYIRANPQLLYFFGEFGDAVRPKIFAGPSLGFLISGKTKSTTGNTTTEVDSKDNYNGFDFGALVGAGANFRVAPGKWLNLDLGYTHGFVDLTKSDNNTAYNRNLAVGIGLTWGIGKVKSQDIGK